jgi:hypothetical protein
VVQATFLADVGGLKLDDLVKRAMGALLTNELAPSFNLTGQQGKRRFLGLLICQTVFGKFIAF